MKAQNTFRFSVFLMAVLVNQLVSHCISLTPVSGQQMDLTGMMQFPFVLVAMNCA
jgi:hypothetical protein